MAEEESKSDIPWGPLKNMEKDVINLSGKCENLWVFSDRGSTMDILVTAVDRNGDKDRQTLRQDDVVKFFSTSKLSKLVFEGKSAGVAYGVYRYWETVP